MERTLEVPARVVQGFGKVLQFLFEEKPGSSLFEAFSHHGTMGSMGRPKGIIHVNVAQFPQ